MSENVANNQIAKKTKKIKKRTLLVFIFMSIFLIISAILFRADYLETVEIGEEYVEVFMQNVKYKVNIGIINFAIVFMLVYITNRLIKRGLSKFFEEEKKEMPKLPNKSLALVIASVTSIVISNTFLQKVILFMNATQFGMNDPIFNMDTGFYMFQAPLIGQLLYYAITILIILTIYTVVYYLFVFNKFFEGIDGQTLRNNMFIKQLLFNSMLIVTFISFIILFNVQNMEIGGFLTLGDKTKTTLIGAGAVDRNKNVGI